MDTKTKTNTETKTKTKRLGSGLIALLLGVIGVKNGHTKREDKDKYRRTDKCKYGHKDKEKYRDKDKESWKQCDEFAVEVIEVKNGHPATK